MDVMVGSRVIHRSGRFTCYLLGVKQFAPSSSEGPQSPTWAAEPTEFEYGLLVGLLVGEGYFGGDKTQPQIVVKMHVRHIAIFNWLVSRWGGKLYGPYHHDGRHYYQWMARGNYLKQVLLPILDARMSPEFDTHSWDRYQAMRHRYGLAPLDSATGADTTALPQPLGG
jgi:hypothetical protein